MNNKTSIRLFVLLVFILPITTYAIIDLYESHEKLPVMVDKEHRIQNFQFTNQDGKTISYNDWKGKIIIANFFFTHCPVICPKMTANLKKVNDAFQDDADIQISSFTVDPGRDDPSQLKKHAVRFSVDTRKWDLLTGDKREIYKLARNSFKVVATDGDGGPGDFIHSEKLILLDKAGRIRGYYEGTNDRDVKKLLRDIKKLKNEN